MKIHLISDSEACNCVVRLVQACTRMDMAVAWAGTNRVVDEMARHKKKMGKLTFGTHMYRTDPIVLREFMALPKARCMTPDGDLFHPKIYLFEMDECATVVIGSHNLTAGAFGGGNVEASIVLSAPSYSPTIKSIRAFINQCWSQAEPIDEDAFLFAYEKQYTANKAKQRELQRFSRLKKALPKATQQSPLNLTWKKFLDGVKTDAHHSLDKRLELLETASEFFTKKTSLARMTTEERKAIAGTYGSKEPRLGNLDWGWFGSMFGQGDFKSLVANSSQGLSDALDRIPIEGPVTANDYDLFKKRFLRSFIGKSHVGGVATASRLLTMKRPDIFVAINKGNQNGLCYAVGLAPSKLSIDSYWGHIVATIQTGDWWLHPRPKANLEARIWDNRAALLDCIYYVPTQSK